MPYYNRYGSELYAGDRLYSMVSNAHKCYNRTEIYYQRTWWTNAIPVSLHAGFSLHFLAGKMATSQLIQLSVALDNQRLKTNRKKKDN